MEALEGMVGQIEDRVSEELGSRAEKDMKGVVSQVVDTEVMGPIRKL